MVVATQLGKYSVVRHLGAGGMAEVFLCRQSGIGGFDKAVVVKRIHDSLMRDPEFVNMFLDEARVASHLAHPNIVQVYEIDEVDGAPYIAMEFVDGQALGVVCRTARKQDRVERGHMVWIAAQIAEALHHAHGATDSAGQPLQIVHRDVSPSNIVMGYDGVPKLLDFGVARAKGRLAQTQAGAVKGKLQYMAPEQVLGLPFDHRADIYALGVSLFYATTGEYPIEGTSFPEIARAVSTGEVRKPSDVDPDYPPELERLILWAMAPHPDQRCPTGRELHQALEAWLASAGYATGRKAVAGWMDELFPAQDRVAGVSPPLSSPSFLSSRSGASPYVSPHTPYVTTSPTGQLGSPRAMGLLLGVLAVALVVIGVLVATLVLGGDGPPAAVPPAIAVSGPAAAAPATDAREAKRAPAEAANRDDDLRTYLVEVERLVESGKLGPAAELLGRAARIEAQDPKLDVRRVELGDRITRARTLKSARAKLADAPAEAEVMARKLLDSDPEDAAAKGLLEAAKRAQDPGVAEVTDLEVEEEPETPDEAGHAEAGGAAGGSGDEAAERGRLKVTSTPPGKVIVDGISWGEAPVKRALDAGRHLLEVRRDGHEPWRRRVRVESGKTAKVKVTLTPSAASAVAAKPTPKVAAADPRPEAPAKKAKVIPPKSDEPAAAKAGGDEARAEAPAKVAEPEPKPEASPSGEYVPRLPGSSVVRDAKQLVRVLRMVENEAIAGGVPASKARNATYAVAKVLVKRVQSEGALRIQTRAFYRTLVQAAAGGGKAAVSARLVGAASSLAQAAE